MDTSGYFLVDGVKQTPGHEIEVSAEQLASTSFTAGSGNDILWVRAFDEAM